jgi:hypothetical protein
MIREADMDDSPGPEGQTPANIRFLSRLVTVLTVTMIAGVLAIVALLVIRISASTPILPESVTLPDGARATAFTQGRDWFAVVTEDDRILIFNRTTGALTQTVEIER